MLFQTIALLASQALVGYAAEWPNGPGTKFEPQYPSYELRHRLNAVSQSRIRSNVEKLVSFKTRSSISAMNSSTMGIGAASSWMISEFESYGGNLEAGTIGFLQQANDLFPNDTRVDNVVAVIKGSVDPDRMYVISGHLDSRNSDLLDTTGAAPGADDDASGISLLMELARVFASSKPAATIMFVGVTGEEQGYLGSAFLAKQLKDQGKDVQGMLNNDIVGTPKGLNGFNDPEYMRMFASGIPPFASQEEIATYIKYGIENDSPSRQLGRFVAEVAQNDVTDIKVGLVTRMDGYGRKGDHTNFLEQGFPVVRFTEPNLTPAHIHQDVRVEDGVQFGDLIDFVDFEYLTRVTKLNGAALFSLAYAPGTPKDVTIAGDPNETILRWTKDPNAASYEIVWRATDAPQWTHCISAGDSGEISIKLSKDNVFFGVRAVGRNGFKSPAGTPFPA